MKNKKVTTVITLVLIALLSTATIYSFKDRLFPKQQIETPVDVKGDTVNTCDLTKEEVTNSFVSFVAPRKWYVQSPEVEQEIITYEILDTHKAAILDITLNGNAYQPTYSDKWEIKIPTETLKPDDYTLVINSTQCDETLTKEYTFKVSKPVYVVWSIDWEGFDVKDQYLKEMADMSKKYDAPMTHFFNPYIYLYINANRAKYLTDWVTTREEYVALHIHMYDRLVQAAGVTVNNNPAWGSPMGRGHDTPNSNYGYDDYKKIITWAINQFEKNGLQRPAIYRAGGWFIDEENLQVLNDLDFIADSSGRTKYTHGSNSLAGHWTLSSTQQPYQLNSNDQNITNNPNMTLWELPNNGADSWAYKSNQLIERFNQNYNKSYQSNTKVITYISHPHWFDKEGPNINGALEYISKYTYNKDNGPVIFITLDKVYQDVAKL